MHATNDNLHLNSLFMLPIFQLPSIYKKKMALHSLASVLLHYSFVLLFFLFLSITLIVYCVILFS